MRQGATFSMKKLFPTLGAITAGFALTGGTAITVDASSHREAPNIAKDQYVDNTDVYAFISPNSADRMVLIANYVPLLDPESGPNFYGFDDEAHYEIRVDNDGDAKTDLTYRWRFRSFVRNGDTFLYNVGPVRNINDRNLNVYQTYVLEKIDARTGKKTKIMEDVPVAPWHVGK